MNDMHNIFRRSGAQTWSVRFHIPRERRSDVGKAYKTQSGQKSEIVKTLQTTCRKEAMGRRQKALDAIRAEIDAKLQAIGLLPLHGEWKPEWAFAWAEERHALDEALEAKKEIEKAATREDEVEEVYVKDALGRLHLKTFRTSERDRKISVMQDILSDRATELQEAGLQAGDYISRYQAVALGEVTPMGGLMQRWFKDIEGTVKRQTLMGHHLSFRLLGDYLQSLEGRSDKIDQNYIYDVFIENLTRRVVGGFPEWLAQERRLTAKTVRSRISPLKVFWDWSERKGYALGVNPWLGATAGLKKRSEQEESNRDKSYPDSDILRLLKADPNTVKKWKYGPAIYDLLRLALLTGARQNELCSLTKGRVIEPETSGGLWAIQVTSEVAKTRNALRLIPIHPLIMPIIKRRLESASPEANALLFPELPPGGPDLKRAWTFSKRFGDFRKAILGQDDAHNFHGLRATFMTYFATAAAKGATACTPLLRDRLVGHTSQALGDNTYVGKLDRGLYEKAILETLKDGVAVEVKEAI
ncbi:hypothetical protein JK174_05185 [Acetobacter thailandicus]|nr:hypothetical protein [Acetobacter thailandicus]